MKKPYAFFVTGARLMLSLAIAGYGASPLAAAPPDIQWAQSLQTAETQAGQTGKLVLLELQSDDCKWCKVEDRTAHLDSRFILLSHEFELCRLDGEKEGKPQIKAYRIDEYPAMVFVDGSGRMVAKKTGYQDSDAYVARMVEVIPDSVIDGLKAAPPGDLASTARLIIIDAGRGRLDEAAALSSRLEHAGDSPSDRIAAAAANHALGEAYLAAKQYEAAAPCLEQVALFAMSDHERDQAHSASKQIKQRTRRSWQTP